MRKPITPIEAKNAAWNAHEAVERLSSATPDGSALFPLLRARRALAERYPGCATAILSADTEQNWDSGQLMKDELLKQAENGENA